MATGTRNEPAIRVHAATTRQRTCFVIKRVEWLDDEHRGRRRAVGSIERHRRLR